ncbi:hypothetical protein MCANPG14_01438 [Mycoplasmopsis canis PG 14]|uniref:Uncharacterized protein n=1 Tax=Mycoplasmopsis canis TaxID=29555 RepID=A0A449AQZ9_9BACT|nr:hypothetical protein [Mycoplasmopsis canis]AMD81233.1 hypothetical protein AXW82_01560 [Mycoplasmopsis canis PG 14]EIE40628.1 hypothetical protein MCANPG14_01438 [Mycoplasmopsis canis PG 14]VEU68796.1 Uncharacterised protein [Mycoplasmopsis canis]
MTGYKRKVITWTIITIIAFISIIILSIFLSRLGGVLELHEHVTLDQKIIDTYNFARSYTIGGLAFACIIFMMGLIISYAGIKSWKYVEMFS